MTAMKGKPFTTGRISRRQMLRRSVQTTAGLWLFGSLAPLLADPASRRFKLGACDWSIGKMGSSAAFEVAKQIGLDGVQVSLGTAADDMRLRQSQVQQEYREAARKAGLEIASLAIGELNNIPYKSDPRTVQWVSDCIDVCRALKLRVVLLAFFGNGDLRDDKAGVDEVVRRLKAVAPKAEKAGVSLGIESWLSAEQHMDILDRVGSPAVKVYYDLCNSNDRGYDIYKEIRLLGSRICEFHAKENGSLLGQGKIDFAKARQAMDDIHFTGWVEIEGAVPEGKSMLDSYKANCKFMRQILAEA
jgi:sugar phosphate isomerase/epimerase